MRPVILGILAMILVLTPSIPATAAEEPLVKQVGQAIERGKIYLLGVGKDKGNWEVDTLSATQEGGWTSLALLALLNAGVPPDDPVIQKGLTFLVRIKPKNTYVVGLQTMVLALVDKDNRYKDQIQGNVNWLVEARIKNDGKLLGWGYGAGDNHGSVNNSNTQYVLLGLHEGMNAGATVAPEVLEEIQRFYMKAEPDGGWGYHRGEDSTLTMTSAGVCGLLITGMDLNAGREKPLAGGKFENCGKYTENKSVMDGLKWIGNALPAQNRWEQMPSFYYTLYGLERVGRLSGLRFIGTHDWYREGCEALVPLQNKDGSWRGRGFDSSPVVSTSFALLFLSKGRTPILISKLTHKGSEGINTYPEDWNNDHNDARHLVEFTSRELFKRTPMGWQVFNTRMMKDGRSVEDLTAELLQSPIAYFNGHYVPEFEGKEKLMLQKYVEEGGFIFAEACCGDDRFDAGFRKLMKELFKDAELTRLTKDHPIWHATDKFDVNPGRFELWGIESGCKTVVIYSKSDLSCWWESNRNKKGAKDDRDDMGPAAFALGANIIAYATGLEPPGPRLIPKEVTREDASERKVPPGYLKVAQLRYGEDPPAKRAMPNLMRHLRAKGGLEVDVEPEKTLTITSKGVNDFKFLYMHGKSEIPAKESAELKYLRYDLEKGGGLLLADACCGSKKFDASFREFIAKLFEGKAKLEPIPISDELFSEELNGPKNAITTVRCRREPASDQRGDGGYKNVEPMLEGVKIGGRWVVIYSKYDIGCALEKIQSSECLGHDHESALRLGSAVVLYALKR